MQLVAAFDGIGRNGLLSGALTIAVATIATHESARHDERVVQLLLAPRNAAVTGGPDRLRPLVLVALSLSRGNASALRRSNAASCARAYSPGDSLSLTGFAQYIGCLDARCSLGMGR